MADNKAPNIANLTEQEVAICKIAVGISADRIDGKEGLLTKLREKVNEELGVSSLKLLDMIQKRPEFAAMIIVGAQDGRQMRGEDPAPALTVEILKEFAKSETERLNQINRMRSDAGAVGATLAQSGVANTDVVEPRPQTFDGQSAPERSGGRVT